jgi:hypothetical protein
LDAEKSDQGNALSQAQIDVGLVVVIQAWPHLPEAIRAGILALIRAAGSDRPQSRHFPVSERT